MITNKNIIFNAIENFGSPLYIFDKTAFIENYRNFEKCMKGEYDKYYVSYSYNYK